MRIRIGNKVKTQQKLRWQTAVLVTTFTFIIAGSGMIFLHLRNPEKALAAVCEYSYNLNFSDTTTFSVSCGSVNAANWTVKGTTCFFYSPIFPVGGSVGDPGKEADISVRINQSGNLDGNDTAWVYMLANDSILRTFRCVGDSVSAVFSTSLTIPVPAGGTYRIVVKMKNDKSNEMWQIKNGDVTSCLRAVGALPITLAGFTAKVNSSNKVDLKWTTFTEINNSYFTIERSSTGTSFEPLSNIKGAGNSNSPIHYSFTDADPRPGTNYYRLKQTDFDGTNTSSNVIKVSMTKSKPGTNDIMVFPNPFQGDFSVKFESETTGEVAVRLVTMDGRVLHSNSEQVEEGTNTISCSPVSQIRSGNYLVQLVSNETVIGSVKVVSR